MGRNLVDRNPSRNEMEIAQLGERIANENANQLRTVSPRSFLWRGRRWRLIRSSLCQLKEDIVPPNFTLQTFEICMCFIRVNTRCRCFCKRGTCQDCHPRSYTHLHEKPAQAKTSIHAEPIAYNSASCAACVQAQLPIATPLNATQIAVDNVQRSAQLRRLPFSSTRSS